MPIEVLDKKAGFSLAVSGIGSRRLAYPFLVLEGVVLVRKPFRFQRFLAMGTTGNFAVPADVKEPHTEWAAAGPFVIALRT